MFLSMFLCVNSKSLTLLMKCFKYNRIYNFLVMFKFLRNFIKVTTWEFNKV